MKPHWEGNARACALGRRVSLRDWRAAELGGAGGAVAQRRPRPTVLHPTAFGAGRPGGRSKNRLPMGRGDGANPRFGQTAAASKKSKKRFCSCRIISTPHGAGRANLMRSPLGAASVPFFLTAWQNWGADGGAFDRPAAVRGEDDAIGFRRALNASYSPRSRRGFCKLRSQAQQFPKAACSRRRQRRMRRSAGCGACGGRLCGAPGPLF